MSDLDKAIRAELETGYWRLSRQTSTAADKGARAILSTLDLHVHTDVEGLRINIRPMRQCAACGLVSREQWCDTVSVIADDLGVSGDRSEPTPAPSRPRQYDRDEPNGVAKVRDRLGRTWNYNDRNGFWYLAGCAPQTWPELWSQLRPLSEVVSPKDTP